MFIVADLVSLRKGLYTWPQDCKANTRTADVFKRYCFTVFTEFIG